MTGGVTWEALIFVSGLLVAAGGVVAAFVIWHFAQTGKANEKIAALQRDLDLLRLEAAKEYAPLSELYKVEARIAAEMKSLRDDFNAGFDRVVDVMRAMVPARRSKSVDPAE